MVKLSLKDKARLEIELLEKSKEVDKYDHKNSVTAFLVVFALIFPILIGIYLDAINRKDWILAGVVILALLIFILIFSRKKLKPIVNEFKKKQRMIRKRYQVLGINLTDLDKELRKTSI
jgi:archaellum biogenesis protein FlaJ (TadC family)